MVAAAVLASGAGVGPPAEAASAWVSPSRTTLTGSFVLGEGSTAKIRTISVTSRVRHVVSVPNNLDLYGVTAHPNETTLTAFVCNQNGCDLPANRLCVAEGAAVVVTQENDRVNVVSTKVGCRMDVTARIPQQSPPRLYSDKVEWVMPAVFADGAKIQGSDAVGSDGRVVRSVSWFAGL